MPRLCHAIAQPAHAAGLLGAIRRRKSEIAVEVLAHLVGVEEHRAQ
jgi:hypothetical protein